MAIEITDELRNYKESVEAEIEKNSTELSISKKEAFVNWALNKLQDYGMIPEPTTFSFYINHSKGALGIDAYCIDQSDDSFSFLIIDYSEEDNSLTADIINDCLRKMNRFVNYAYNDVLKNVTDSDEVKRAGDFISFQLHKEYSDSDILRVKYFVLSNRFYRARTTPLVNDSKYLRQTVSINVWGIDKFFSADSSGKQREPITIHFDQGLQFVHADLSDVDKYESYLCIIPGKVLANIYRTYGSALLEQNVRSFLGANSKINKGMIATIRNNPTEFFIYNNGIAVTGSNIQITDGKITEIEDMQIINGGQTTASIYTAMSRGYSNLDKIFVQMKLTIVKDDQDYNEVVNNISRYSNSQTAVRPGDLFASHPFHVKFEQLSKNVIAPAKEGQYTGTYWYYERSRGKYKQETFNLSESKKNIFKSSHPKEQVIKKEELAKYYMTMLPDPVLVAKGSAKCMAAFGTKADEMFKADEDHTKINKNFFQRCIVYAIIFRELDKEVYKAPWYSTNSAKNVLVPYAIARVLSEVPANMSFDYNLIWNEQKVYFSLLNALMKAARDAKKFFEEKASQGLVTELAKREEVWKEYKSRPLKFDQDFYDDLVSKDFLDGASRQARKEDSENNFLKHRNIICSHSSGYWVRLLGEAKRMCMNSKQLDFIKTASQIPYGKKFPSDAQFKAIWNVLEELKSMGVDIEEEEESDSDIIKITSNAFRDIDID